MAAKPVLVDTNLAILLTVGLAGKELIARHKNLRVYDERDFGILVAVLAEASEILFTPHTLTETSNLMRQIGEPVRATLSRSLANLIGATQERFVTGVTATRRSEYERLGLTDSALLSLAETGAVLLTDDLHLYLAAASAGYGAVNFSHLREARPDFH